MVTPDQRWSGGEIVRWISYYALPHEAERSDAPHYLTGRIRGGCVLRRSGWRRRASLRRACGRWS
jgi:hypothetical protein